MKLRDQTSILTKKIGPLIGQLTVFHLETPADKEVRKFILCDFIRFINNRTVAIKSGLGIVVAALLFEPLTNCNALCK